MVSLGPLLLSPPYRRMVPLDSVLRPPRLGSVVLLRDLGLLAAAMPETGLEIRGAPWVPVVLELRPGQRLGPGSAPVAVVFTDGEGPPPPEALLSALARRPPPSAEMLGQWLANRVGRPELAQLLVAAVGFRRTIRSPMHERAVRRGLARNQLPRRLDWTRLGELSAVAGMEGEAAARFGGEARLALWVRRLAGVSVATWRRRPGWEWLAERFVRRIPLS
jgi:hypothetical protein